MSYPDRVPGGDGAMADKVLSELAVSGVVADILPPISTTQRRSRAVATQIIPICVIGAGSDAVGEAVQNGGSVRLA